MPALRRAEHCLQQGQISDIQSLISSLLIPSLQQKFPHPITNAHPGPRQHHDRFNVPIKHRLFLSIVLLLQKLPPLILNQTTALDPTPLNPLQQPNQPNSFPHRNRFFSCRTLSYRNYRLPTPPTTLKMSFLPTYPTKTPLPCLALAKQSSCTPSTSSSLHTISIDCFDPSEPNSSAPWIFFLQTHDGSLDVDVRLPSSAFRTLVAFITWYSLAWYFTYHTCPPVTLSLRNVARDGGGLGGEGREGEGSVEVGCGSLERW